LEAGRELVLGGVSIPYEKGLLGHSDADVLLHAISDALLGAAGLGDIGDFFPNTEERYRGADSLLLLRVVVTQLRLSGYEPANIDATIIAQVPKMKPYIQEMRGNIASACKLEEGFVNVKATTEEGLGFTGAGAGIAAHAVCTVRGDAEWEE